MVDAHGGAYDGRLLRIDPATGFAQTWTVADDAAFASSDIAGARAAGVWLARGGLIEILRKPALAHLSLDFPDAIPVRRQPAPQLSVVRP